MGNPSTIEMHPEKEAIEVAIQKGVPYRLSSEYRLVQYKGGKSEHSKPKPSPRILKSKKLRRLLKAPQCSIWKAYLEYWRVGVTLRSALIGQSLVLSVAGI